MENGKKDTAMNYMKHLRPGPTMGCRANDDDVFVIYGVLYMYITNTKNLFSCHKNNLY